MPPDAPTAFLSYSREDSEFALRLAEDLKAAGAAVWLDQLDIAPGQRWARAVQEALQDSPRMLVILSPASVGSNHVEDEVNFALDEQKTVIPVFYRDCKVPFRLRPLQYVDFRTDYAHGLKIMLKTLAVKQQSAASLAAAPTSPGASPLTAAHAEDGGEAPEEQPEDEHKRVAERTQLEEEQGRVAAEKARLEEEERTRQVADEKARLEEQQLERQSAAEKARLEHEERAAEQAWLEEKERRRQAADEKARLEQQERERQAAAEKARLEQEERQRQAVEQVRGEKNSKLAGEQAQGEQARLEQEPEQVAEPARPDEQETSDEGISHPDRERQILAVEEQRRGLGQGSAQGLASGVASLLSNLPLWAKIVVASCGILIVAAVLYWALAGHPSVEPAAETSQSPAGTSTPPIKSETPLLGWAVGSDGSILHTDDGGRSWQKQNSGTILFLSSVAFVSPQSGFAVGEEFLHTEDGGRSWKNRGELAPRLDAITFLTAQLGWAVGIPGWILHTEDGGRSWKRQPSGTKVWLESVAFLTPKLGWAVGYNESRHGGAILHTDDGGRIWQKQSVDIAPYSVTFLTRQSGWIVGDEGTILQTEDGGRTWHKQDSGTATDLRFITFLTPQSGWIVGDEGTILHTEDGGQSWHKQDSGTTTGLESITFVPPQSGWIVGNKGTILHTEDGGQSWHKQDSGTTTGLESITFVPP